QAASIGGIALVSWLVSAAWGSLAIVALAIARGVAGPTREPVGALGSVSGAAASSREGSSPGPRCLAAAAIVLVLAAAAPLLGADGAHEQRLPDPGARPSFALRQEATRAVRGVRPPAGALPIRASLRRRSGGVPPRL